MSMKMCTTLNTDLPDCGKHFIKAKREVAKLQKRIRTAYQKGDVKLMKSLQYRLFRSRYAKALAVFCILQKSGCNSPGVDNITWGSLQEGYETILPITPSNYVPMPLKRIYFTKSNGKRRPIGVPTLTDRAMQTLFKFALEPIAEMTADGCSFAYRRNRSAKDAILYILNILQTHPELDYFIKMDIQSCFDNISQEWLLAKMPIDQKILYRFLRCGYIENNRFYMTDRGIPQGGCVSSVLCNLTLDGLESLMDVTFGHSVRMVRYADDIAVLAPFFSHAGDVLSVIGNFLQERALELSNEKTELGLLCDGFDYLGYHFQKNSTGITCMPAEGKKDAYLSTIDDFMLKHPTASTNELYDKLAPKIRGWFHYYMGIVPLNYLLEVKSETLAHIVSLTGNTSLAADINTKAFKKLNRLAQRDA